MTLVTRRKQPKKNTSSVIRTESYPAPVRGLNFKNSLANMRPDDALVLDNVVCRAGYIEVRRGWAPTATGFAATVETLFPYTNLDGTNKLFAAAGTGIFDATASGAIGAAVVTGLTSAYWAQTQMGNAAGNWLLICNGQDNAKTFNGTVWADSTVTGVAITALSQVCVFKRRVWYVQKNTMRAWYLAADAIGGAATAFDFTGIFQRGGRLLALIPWTVDGGAGSDDYLLGVSTMGEVAVYKGTDPSVASNFALVGVYYVGAPVGERFWTKLGGDVIMLTAEGVIPISKYLQSQTVDKSTFLSDRVQQLISDEISTYASVRGWELVVYLDDNFLLIQVPAGAVGARYQYCMSLITGGWSRFLVAPAVTWAVQGQTLYHGQATRVANGWIGGLDNTTGIQYTIIPAFSDFGAPTVEKHYKLGRATVQTDQPPQFNTQLLKNYDTSFSFPSGSNPTAVGALWDVGLWDLALWGGTNVFYQDWYSFNDLAYAASQVIQGISIGTTWRLVALDYAYESARGTVL